MKLLQKNKRCTWSQDTYMSVLMYQGYFPPKKNNRRPIDEIAQKKQKMYLVPRYVYVGTFVPGLHPPPKKNRGPIDEIAKKKTKTKNNLNTELKEMGVFSAVAGNQLPNQLQKGVLPALFHQVPLAITPTFSPWTHTSDDSCIYQLSLV